MSGKNIVILTGAGISAESGIRTFRDGNGLWEEHAIEDVATPEAFARNPNLVHKFYNARRKQLLEPEIKPNAAHYALAKLEAEWRGGFFLVTQNVDNLHERAGSKKLLHMHGELLKARCLKTGNVVECTTDLDTNGNFRPHIVWFGEMPFEMDLIYERLDDCDLFLSIGTSGNVYPAAGFAQHVRCNGRYGRETIELNLDDTQVESQFDRVIRKRAGDALPDLVDEILKTQ